MGLQVGAPGQGVHCIRGGLQGAKINIEGVRINIEGVNGELTWVMDMDLDYNYSTRGKNY